MQDSDEDKAHELPKMRSIYKSAAVTVVAAIAKSAKEGFLHHIERNPAYFIEPITLPVQYPSGNVLRQMDVVLNYPADYKRWKDPINDRAWTFQELLLSDRTILFSYRGVQLTDRTSKPDADGLTSGKDPQLPNLPWSGKLFSLTVDPENTRQVWLALRGEYSRRSLSYQGDKLLAIAAVAEELGRTYDSRYLAGIWERDLAMDLQWKCPRDPDANGVLPVRNPRPTGYVAPSWSWASVDSPVEDHLHVWEEDGEIDGAGLNSSLGFEIVSCEVQAAVPNFEYGAVKSGVLVVKGLVRCLIWRPHKEDNFNNLLESDGFLIRHMESTTPSDGLYQDTAIIDALDPELIDGAEVTCLATRSTENVRGRDDVEGLMLLPVDEDRYRRVGFFRLTRPDSVAGFEYKTITII
jgi:hypothetical protein